MLHASIYSEGVGRSRASGLMEIEFCYKQNPFAADWPGQCQLPCCLSARHNGLYQLFWLCDLLGRTCAA